MTTESESFRRDNVEPLLRLEDIQACLILDNVAAEERRLAARALPMYLDRDAEHVFDIADVTVMDTDDEVRLNLGLAMPRFVAADPERAADILHGILHHDYEQADPEIVREVEAILQNELAHILGAPHSELQMRYIRILKQAEEIGETAPPKRPIKLHHPLSHLEFGSNGDVFYGGGKLGNLYHGHD